MAQGKEFTKEQKDEIMQSLKTYLEMGFSRNRACSLIGLPPTTLSNWVLKDEALGIKLEGWENMITALAISNIKSAIRLESKQTKNIEKNNSWRWAERKLKELSPKTEVEHTVKELPIPLLNALLDNNGNQENIEVKEED